MQPGCIWNCSCLMGEKFCSTFWRGPQNGWSLYFNKFYTCDWPRTEVLWFRRADETGILLEGTTNKVISGKLYHKAFVVHTLFLENISVCTGNLLKILCTKWDDSLSITIFEEIGELAQNLKSQERILRLIKTFSDLGKNLPHYHHGWKCLRIPVEAQDPVGSGNSTKKNHANFVAVLA